MRVGRARGTLLSRIERLECRTQAESRLLRLRFGHLHRLPEDYAGERHVVITEHLPSRSGQEWVEFEEAPGPDPSLPEQAGAPKYLDIVFAASNRASERFEKAEQAQ